MNGRTNTGASLYGDVQITTLMRVVLCPKGKSMLMSFQSRRIAGTVMKASMEVHGVKTSYKVKFPNILQMKLSGLMGGNETLILQPLFHFHFLRLILHLPAFVSQ